MENIYFTEMRNRLAMLPVLNERANKLCIRISEAENEVKSLLEKFEAETLDVESLKAEKLSVYILKTIGRYEGKLNKETEEMLQAKMQYDKASAKLNELKQLRKELEDRLAELNQDQRRYEAEFSRREEVLRSNLAGEASIKYQELEKEREACYCRLAETDEALSAANRVISTIDTAMEHLDSAEGWATYDVWFRGGIISHMAKYDHIDNAEAAFNGLRSQMDNLRRELSDVDISGIPEFSGIDSTTRAIDFWFDNIFTDLNVRSRIREDSEQLRELRSRIFGIARKLEGNKSSLKGNLSGIETKKNELIING